MPTLIITEASAASAAGTNLMANNRFSVSNTYRKVVRIGVVGSSAVGNASIDVFYGATMIANNLKNTSGGANLTPLEAKDIVPLRSDYWCEPGEPLIVSINTPSASNALTVYLEVAER